MADIASVLKQLRDERGRIGQAIAALANLNGDPGPGVAKRKAFRPPLSAEARRRIAAAQRARWAKVRTSKSGAVNSSKPARRVMSIAAHRKIAAAQRARWAKLKKAT